MLNILVVELAKQKVDVEFSLNLENANILKIQYSPLFRVLVKESRPDVIVFNLDTPSEKLLSDLVQINQQEPVPVIMFANDGSEETIEKVMRADVSAFIVDDLDTKRFESIMQVAIARFKQLQLLKETLDDLRTQLDDRKQIDRAKAILIKTQNFTENEAYHTLRKLAMDRNITLGEMARNVIAMAELLK
jgi:two-component system, response regulator / RNA-binding antiterminator